MTKPSFTDRLIFVDTEDANPIAPEDVAERAWTLREFGAVHYGSRATFHGRDDSRETFEAFHAWIREVVPGGNPVFITDNIAYDWPPIHYNFHRYFRKNPFGHSARRIGDFYAGLCGDFVASSRWKKLRITPHDHNPVNDAMGNVEAFERMLKGERV